MNYLEQTNKIKKETLNHTYYFQSLLEQGYEKQLLSASDCEKLQMDCLILLAKQVTCFNNGNSSSIPIEKAQEILTSIMFTVGVQLKTFLNPEDALAGLLENGVENIFTAGCKSVEGLVKRANLRHIALVGKLFPTKNVFYSSTIVDGIKGFFRLYNPQFSAQEIHITADYPVYNKVPPLLGIEFIEKYLEQLYYENSFLIHFSADSIHYLLCGYDEQYPELLFNLYEPVLATSLGCVLAHSDVTNFAITTEVHSILFDLFHGRCLEEIEQLLAFALEKLAEQLSLSNGLQCYAKQSLSQLALSIKNALQTGSLKHIFLQPKYPQVPQLLTLSFGVKMDDELYRTVLDEFMCCQSMSGKISIIKECIHSLADFNDLLLDSFLEIDEILVCLKELSPIELAALAKKYNATDEMGSSEFYDPEKTLCLGLHQFIAALPSEKQVLLKNTINILEIDQ